MQRVLIPALTLLLAAGCTWVRLDPGAEDVLVLPQSRLTPQCDSLGKVRVSVADRVGALERHDDEVANDLAVLARNHAAKRGADTVVPLAPVEGGQREYGVYKCTEGTGQNRDQSQPTDDNGVEVLPYDESDGN